MKIIGVLFVVFGFLWAIGGLLSTASDIQLNLAVSGINMIGIGVIMIKLSEKPSKN